MINFNLFSEGIFSRTTSWTTSWSTSFDISKVTSYSTSGQTSATTIGSQLVYLGSTSQQPTTTRLTKYADGSTHATFWGTGPLAPGYATFGYPSVITYFNTVYGVTSKTTVYVASSLTTLVTQNNTKI